MMNKKGIEKKMVLEAVIAVLIIGIFFGAFLYYDIPQIIKDFVPSMNNSIINVESPPKVMYDIIEDEVSYWTGAKFVKFESLLVDGEELSSESLKNVFRGYWYGVEDGEGYIVDRREKSYVLTREIYEDFKHDIKRSELSSYPIIGARPLRIGDYAQSVRKYGKGYVYGVFAHGALLRRGDEFDRSSQNIERVRYGIFFMSMDNEIYTELDHFNIVSSTNVSFKKYGRIMKQDRDSNTYEILSRFLVNWRDSILKTPILIMGGKHCVEEWHNQYLIVDLAVEESDCKIIVVEGKHE